MTESTNSSNPSIDKHVLEEFQSDYNYAHSEIESLLLALEQTPNDTQLLNKLFREVHSIKGNSHFLGFQEMTDFLHALETVLEKLRNGDLFYNHSIGDIVLKAVDQIANILHDVTHHQPTNRKQTESIQNDLSNLVTMVNLARPN